MKKLNAKAKARFLDKLAGGTKILKASSEIGFSHQKMYQERAKDEEFKERWEEAMIAGAIARLEALEAEADKRAVEGYHIVTRIAGRPVKAVTVYSNRLLELRIKAEAARAGDNSYRERVDQQHSGEVGIRKGVLVVPGELVPTSWDEMAKRYEQMGPPPIPYDGDLADLDLRSAVDEIEEDL